MNRQALYGVIAGLFFSSWMLTEYYMGWAQSPFYTIIRFFPVAGILIILGILRKRSETVGLFRIPQGFRAGMSTAIIFIVLASIAMYINYKYVNTEFVKHTYEQTLQNLLKQDPDLEKATAQAAPTLKNLPKEAAVYTVILNLPLTLILSLAAAFALRKNQDVRG